MWSAIAGLATWLFGLIFPKKVDPTAVTLADSNARSQDKATQETANEQVVAAGAVDKSSADTTTAGELRDSGSPNQVNNNPDAPINTDPDAHFRKDS